MKKWTAITAGIAAAFSLGAVPARADGELPSSAPQLPAPRITRIAPADPTGSIKINRGLPAGKTICRDWPLAPPYRPIGWGANCNEFYGPTYYYPSTRLYESNNPSYYPHYLPRLWPNYKTDAEQTQDYRAISRSGYYWDDYDDWTRGARYDEHQ
ncbi:MAG: hypothetical protein K1X53_17785 [Candidatus Sumerlaeaceae bacterium]|nr:hypothetical protein [Candidatus Sumerlaeaceae bacterium]